MNFINRALLRFSLLPAGLYRKLGVDVFQLECIVATKLTIDDRRPNPIRQIRKTKNAKPTSSATLITMLLSFVMGCFYVSAFSFGKDIVSQLTMYFSFFTVLLAFTLISDFTAVLIDVRDNYIILPKPVNDRTVLVARLVHIFIHLCRIIIPMMIAPSIYLSADYGVAGILGFIVTSFLATLFSIFLINAFYLLILKITTAQKFQSVISYMQIIMAIVLYGSYQVSPRILGKYQNIDIDISANPWALLVPPYWFASGWKLLTQWSGRPIECIGAVLCVLVPAACIYVVVRFLAPAFNQKLSMITTSGDGPVVPMGTQPKVAMGSPLLRGLARGFTRKGAERMGFLFAWKITSRSRDFKLKVYPSIGYMVVWVVIMWMNNKNMTLDQISNQTSSGRLVIIVALYMCSFLLMSALTYLSYSEKYKASWIYYVAPIQRPGLVISGGVKAVIVKFFIPIVLLVTVPFLVLAGPSIFPNLLLGLFNQLLIAAMRVYAAHKDFPFSQYQGAETKVGGSLRVLAVFLLIFILGGLHYLVYEITPVVYVLAILSIVATWYVLDSIKGIEWDKIRAASGAE